MKADRCAITVGFASYCLVGLLFSFPLSAVEKQETTKEQLEEEVEDLKTTIEALKDTVEKLEVYVVKDKKRARRQLNSVRRAIKRKHRGLKIGGYGSYGFTSSSSDFDDGSITLRDDVIFRTDTMGALQFDYIINDKFSTTVQLVGEAADDFEVFIDWAYVTYRFSDNWRMLLGRSTSDLNLYSSQLKTGISYPWVRPPMGFYTTSFSGVDQLQVFYSKQMGPWSHLVNGIFISSELTLQAGVDVVVADTYGVSYQLDYHEWTARVVALTSDVDVDLRFGSGIVTLNDNANNYTAALRYDDSDWFFLLESYAFRAENSTLVDNDAYLTSVGRYFDSGRYMLYAIATVAITSNGLGFVPDPKHKSHGVGIRYNVHPQIALKAEWQHFDSQENFNFPNNTFSAVIDVAF